MTIVLWFLKEQQKEISYQCRNGNFKCPIKQVFSIFCACIHFGIRVWNFCNPSMSFNMHATQFKVFNANYLFDSLTLKTPYGIIELDHVVWTCPLWHLHWKCWCLHHEIVSEQFSLQPAHPCFKIDHVGSSGKFSYMFPVYMVITSENEKIIWKVVFKILTYFAKIRALFRHFYGRNADIW